MKNKFNIGDEVYAVKEQDLSVKKFTVGAILQSEDGIFYSDIASNVSTIHAFAESEVYKTDKELAKRIEEIIEEKTNEYRKKLAESVGKGV